jgi:hypothetical protein
VYFYHCYKKLILDIIYFSSDERGLEAADKETRERVACEDGKA